MSNGTTSTIDDPQVQQIADWLALFVAPEDVAELRALKVTQRYGKPCTVAGYFDGKHLPQMAKKSHELTEQAKGIYLTLNPLKPEILARAANRVEVGANETANDQHVQCRRFILIDTDPVRLAGISATDAEKAAAGELSESIRKYLTELNWPAPILADSGNGYHLFYRVDLPADDGGLVQRCLAALAKRFDTDKAKVDTAVYNPARIVKVPGTLAKKGDNTQDRPHRRGRIIDAPKPLDVVPVKLLEALANEATPPPARPSTPSAATPKPSRNGERQHRLDVARWLADRGVSFRVKDTPDGKGRTVFALKHCPFNPDHAGADAAVMQAANGQLSFKCFHNSCSSRGWRDAKKAIGEPDAEHYDPPLRGRTGPTKHESAASDDRPEIVITTEEHEVNEQAVRSLAHDNSIFQRGNILVRIVRDGSPASNGIRRPFTPRIDPLPAPLLRERLAANARWIKLRQVKDILVEESAHPPSWCVPAVHARGEWPGIRYLEAVVDYPVLRPDGTILYQPGYDPSTGLLLDAAWAFPAIPDRPSKSDAIAARDALLEVVADFPFERPVHKAAWLAGLLTPLARFAFVGPAPLFLVDSNTRGAGKGLLLDCNSRIATGERFTIAAYTSDEDELRKRITSLALAGDRLVLFDNLDGKFGNAVLDAALTGTNWKDRVLGVNRMAEAPLFMTWYATGNNVCIAADTARRVCHIRLESPEERPEERRDFRHHNLLAWVGDNRFKLLMAALTILRAYCAAGRPDQRLPAWGSFEGWSGLIRSAIVWIDMLDPGETRLLLQEHADLGVESMSVILASWEKLDPLRRGLTTAGLVQKVKDASENPPDYIGDLRDGLEAFLGKLDARLLGNKLRSCRRRIFAGRYIDKVGTEHSAVRWAVFPAAEFRRGGKHTPHTPHTPTDGECGETGESFSPNGQVAYRAVEIGDFVQWTSQGMDMFPVPQKVTGLSDCGKFAFVEGEKTGLPVDQLTIMGDTWEGAPVATGVGMLADNG